MKTYEELYNSRCNSVGEPLYWVPRPMNATNFTLYGDDDMPCEDSWGIAETVSRVLALGLHLELPVGQWANEGRKHLSGLPPAALDLLKTNIKDEAAHERGFRFAAEAYPVEQVTYDEAGTIAKDWLENTEHPLAKAAISEVGIFLVTLGVLRICGGKSLAEFSAKISHDEARHVSTNRSVLFDTGYRPDQPSNSLMALRRQTLAWVMEHLRIPGDDLGVDEDITADYLIRQSDSLIQTGEAPAFDELVYFGTYRPPFEMSNADMYDREVVLG